MYTLGIDIGTTNIKSVLFKEKALPVAQSVCEYKTEIPQPSWAQQQAMDWWNGTVSTIQAVLSRSQINAVEIAAIAVSCHAPTMLPVDKTGEPLSSALIWMDRRSFRQCDMLSQKIGKQRIFKITGNRADPFYLLSKLIWFKETYPQISNKIYKILAINSYINFKLTGEFKMDLVQASLTQVYDVKKHRWSEELINLTGFDASIFPDVIEGYEAIGQVNSKAATITGLKKGTIVLAGTVDSAAAAIEAGIIEDRIAGEMTGTSSVFMMSSTRQGHSYNLTSMYSILPHQYLSLGPMSSTGASLKWLRDILYKNSDVDSYVAMEKEVSQDAQQPTGIIFLPYMAGERAPIWDNNARGTFIGLTLASNRGQIIRSIMEGSAFALRDNFEEAIDAGNCPNKFRIVGGQTNSNIWLKIKASVLNREIEVIDNSLGAPGGLAFMLGLYTGEFSSIEEAIKNCLRIRDTVDPVKEWVERYKELYIIYKNIYRHLKNDFVSIAKENRQSN